ncbi:hypothetical protein SASPL_104875 [Salvia splendens]|uniref:Uncharacterized protein n=1 Tax=Salvia splendens TaxID=180675 RepID=A0A8X8YMI9_SALSN|nr:hypothetical protein SASPL_104875 [Salvia splendens]
MAPKLSKSDKKLAYDQKLCQFIDEYTQILVVFNPAPEHQERPERQFRGSHGEEHYDEAICPHPPGTRLFSTSSLSLLETLD